jgi:hypothetical protein
MEQFTCNQAPGWGRRLPGATKKQRREGAPSLGAGAPSVWKKIPQSQSSLMDKLGIGEEVQLLSYRFLRTKNSGATALLPWNQSDLSNYFSLVGKRD